MKPLKVSASAALSLLALFFLSAVVYAATSYNVPSGQSSTVNEWSTCYVVTNTATKGLFVPTNTSGEWSSFYGHPPAGVSLGSCCTANSGQSCTSAANACGQTNTGTYSCSGVCSATTPANPSYYGGACTLTSPANSCGTTQTCSGTLDCSNTCTGTCSAPANPAGYGNSCTSAANACGQTNTGTIQCNGTCSATTPANPAGYGSACTSAANACGQTNTGTIQCNGTCSATTPANPSYYGGACTLTSGANSCGTTQTCSGTLDCSNTCTGTCNPPAIPGVQTCSACNGAGCNYGSTDSCGNNCNALLPYFCWSTPGGCTYGSTAGSPAGTNVCQAKDPSYYGQACTLTSAANICGATNTCSGTLDCSDTCSGTCAAPANPPSYQACGTDGNVHTYNGCGTDQGIAQTCHYGCSNATCATGSCIGNGGSAGSYTNFTVTTGSLPTGYAYVGCAYQVYSTAYLVSWNSQSSSGCSAQFNAGAVAGSTAAVTMTCQ